MFSAGGGLPPPSTNVSWERLQWEEASPFSGGCRLSGVSAGVVWVSAVAAVGRSCDAADELAFGEVAAGAVSVFSAGVSFLGFSTVPFLQQGL